MTKLYPKAMKKAEEMYQLDQLNHNEYTIHFQMEANVMISFVIFDHLRKTYQILVFNANQ